MKIFFFGAGSFAHSIWEKELKSKIYTDEYLAFIDNNPALCKGFSGGIKIIKPCDIDNYELDYVVITSLIYETSIREQLTEQLKLPKEKILTFAEYSRKSYARWAYWNRYGSRDRNTKATANKLESLVVYTSITGNYDKLKEPLFVADNITYVCFTNNYDIKSKIWNVEYIKNSSIDNNHLAKHFKMNPHLYFPDYEISVWVDGKYQIMDDFRMYLMS